MKYFKHDNWIKIVDKSNLDLVKNYMKSLLNCLLKLKKINIIHIDIKHLNFLYNIEKKTG